MAKHRAMPHVVIPPFPEFTIAMVIVGGLLLGAMIRW